MTPYCGLAIEWKIGRLKLFRHGGGRDTASLFGTNRHLFENSIKGKGDMMHQLKYIMSMSI